MMGKTAQQRESKRENADNKCNEHYAQNAIVFHFRMVFFLKRQNSPDYFLLDDFVKH